MRYGLTVIILTLVSIAIQAQDDPPPGEIYSVNGTNLHLHCMGESEPTIILESGIGGFTLNWTAVQPQLAESYRVCSYDRRGYGWSDPLTTSFTLENAVGDLYALLTAAEVEPPYVFVAHSFGGVLSRAYHATYPDHVLGMVMLDAIHPQMPERVAAYPSALPRQLDQLDRTAGLIRAFAASDGEVPLLDAFVPNDADALFLDKVLEEKFLETSKLEALYMVEAIPAYPLPDTLGEMPLVVVTHGTPETRSFLGAPMTPEQATAAEVTWQALQAELAALSSQGRLVVAEGSSHSIQFDQPDLVLDLVLVVVAATTA
jgi:pimeloyl-ACP methyl ester carboxylesterase